MKFENNSKYGRNEDLIDNNREDIAPEPNSASIKDSLVAEGVFDKLMEQDMEGEVEAEDLHTNKETVVKVSTGVEEAGVIVDVDEDAKEEAEAEENINRRRRTFARILIIIFLVIALVFTRCSGPRRIGNFEVPAEENIEITVWSISTETDAFHQSYLRAIQVFEENNPGVTIRFETFDNESYKTKIRLAVATNELPDIFFSWGGGFSRPFVSSGKVLALDDFYEEYSYYLPITMLENVIFDGRIYGSVMTTPVSATFYNRAIFREHGLEAPNTWEDLIRICEVLIEAGITPMGISAKDTWVLAMLYDAIALKTMGPDNFRAALIQEEGSFDEEGLRLSAAKFVDLVEMGTFSRRASVLSNDEAIAEFLVGEVAMFTTGSWMAGSIQTDTDNPDDFGVFRVPLINESNAQITDFMGGGLDTLMVAASTPHPELASRAVFELTRYISKYAYLEGAGIPAWRIDFDDREVNPLTKQVAEYAASATSFTPWADTFMEADDASLYLSLLQQLFLGRIAPEEFVQLNIEMRGDGMYVRY